jgi:capsular polysaccharide biosynthesis protein
MSEPIAQIQAACDYLDRGCYPQALELLDKESNVAPVVRECIRATAQGLIAERDGDTAKAESCLDRAFALGVPLPALLHQQACYFNRSGQYERAYQCCAVLQNFSRPAQKLFRDGLPQEQLARYAPWVMKGLLRSPRPKHWFYPPIKQALTDELGTEAAALAFAQMAGNELGDVATLPLTSLRDFARTKARGYEELVTSRTLRVPPLPVFGDSRWDGFESRTRTVFFCLLDDVVVSSKSNLLLANERALLDYQDGELEKVALDFQLDPSVLATEEESLTVLIEAGAVTGNPLQRALSLVGVNTYNFGHWLIEFLPKVWACSRRRGFESVPILVDEQMHPQLRPALEFFVGADHPIVVLKRGKAVRVKELWTCSSITYFAFSGGRGPRDAKTIDGKRFAELISTVEAKLESVEASAGPRRIYLTRKDTQHRRLVNRAAVEEWFAAQGFSLFDFGDLPFAQQISLVRGADLVVGPDGSALHSAFFARAGTRVGYLNNPHLEDHWWIAEAHRSLGHHLSILIGEVVADPPDPTKSDYQIEIDALPGFVDELISR